MSIDRFVYVKDDGSIILHEENDGYQYMRHGPQAVECTVTFDELKHNYPDPFTQACCMLANASSS